MKMPTIMPVAITFLAIFTTSIYADGLFRTCGRGNCTIENVKGKGQNICLKLPKGCCVINMEHDTREKIFSQITLGNEVLVDAGALILCGVGDFYGTTNGTTIRDRKTGIQYKFNTKSEKFIKIVSRNQSQNTQNEELRHAQQVMKAEGYNPGPSDGIMGSRTKEALRLYQAKHGLPVTGELDEASRKAFSKKLDNPSIIKWNELEDSTNTKHRKLVNKIELHVHPGEPTRYAVTDGSGKGIKVADGKFGNRTYSGGMIAETWVGSRDGEFLDKGFYALLGVGTEIKLPQHWVSIFGIRCKDGNIFIRKDGIELSSDTTIERQ